MTATLRYDDWIERPDSVKKLIQYMGLHLVAYPDGSSAKKFGGQVVSLDPEKQTVSLRRYDTSDITIFPLPTTVFCYTTVIESPYQDLAVGQRRQFEWYWDADGRPMTEPVTLVGTVEKVKDSGVTFWVPDNRMGGHGWWAHLKNEDAVKHAVRTVDLRPGSKN
ncbi:hypothetical protein [Streptomyces sp. NBC_00439]|uniref:hypothetical protein n=1 Tax=Streptomyces sp. NBC_00439 TaxID=2903650 RepID=UPI00224FAB29|nr:hypothetical protein [Streptomyces sp. NBC_00439]MCX5103471.1 hypothetical protein [Streptomyces sp. NBC_00439]